MIDEILARLTRLEKVVKEPVEDKKFYTIKESAKYLNVSERQVFRYLKRGLLKRTGVDYKNQITAASLKAFPNTLE